MNTLTATLTATPTPTQAVPTSIDPYKCYRIKGSEQFKNKEVRVTDAFGRTRTRLLKPFFLCNPSVVRTGTPGVNGEQVNPEAQMICFKIRDENLPPFPDVPANVRTSLMGGPPPSPPSFSTLQITDIVKGQLLCLPAALVRPTPQAEPRPTCGKAPMFTCPGNLTCNSSENVCHDPVGTPTPTWTPNDN